MGSRVLHVVDDRVDAEVVMGLLDHASFVERLATVGVHDLATRAPAAAADVVVLDVASWDQKAQAGFIEVRRRLHDTPIVVLSSDDDPSRAVAAVAQGADDLLVKWTFDAPALGRAILLARARGRAKVEAARKIERALRAGRFKSDMLATVCHEVRTPLGTVLGMAELLADTALSEKQAMYLGSIRRAGDHLLAVVNDVLDTARAESGHLPIEHEPFDLLRDVEAAVEFLAPSARSKRLALRVDVGGDVPRAVKGDERRLRQVLVNLVGNAVKFTEHGEVRVVVSRDAKDGAVRFSVYDTGIGIPPEKIDQVFGRFVQGDDSIGRRYGGAGLGLTIAKCLVEAMGGRIWVESTVGKGTAFHVAIPLDEADARAVLDIAAAARETPPAAHDERRRRMRVLVVDDSWESRTLVSEYLAPHDVTIEYADDGPSALAKVESSSYDVVLMDLNLPKMDGFATTLALRKMERERRRRPVPVIALSADALPESVRRSLAVGCTLHLAKPIKRSMLVDAVRSHALDRPAALRDVDAGPSARALALMPRFLDNRSRDVATIRDAVEHGDFATIARLGHVMRGNGASYGLPRVTAIGRRLEAAAHAGDAARVRAYADELETCVALARGTFVPAATGDTMPPPAETTPPPVDGAAAHGGDEHDEVPPPSRSGVHAAAPRVAPRESSRPKRRHR